MQHLTKDVSQCELTHQLPFVSASSSVCQGPGHTGIISIPSATSATPQLYRKPLGLPPWFWRSAINIRKKPFCVQVNSQLVIHAIQFRYCHCTLTAHLILYEKMWVALCYHQLWNFPLTSGYVYSQSGPESSKTNPPNLSKTFQSHSSSCRVSVIFFFFQLHTLHTTLRCCEQLWLKPMSHSCICIIIFSLICVCDRK